MRLNSLFALFFAMSFGLLLSSCTPGMYVGASAGYPYGYGGYGPRYYGGPGYYAPPVRVVRPAPYYRPAPHFRGGGGYHGDGGFHGGYGGGGRRGGR